MEKKKKILVVDDETDFLEVIKIRLEASNYEVITATSGEEALKLYKEVKPSAIILDVLLPGINGMEVLEKIRKDNPSIPVLIITAFTSEERFKLANKFNATGFVLKTENIKDQIESINEAIKLAEKYK